MSDPLATVPLSAVRVFEAAARLLSFTPRGEELGMTQAAVSWQVKALERRLDQPLFRRLPREVALTPAGERLARAASEAVAALRSALSDITQDGDGVLVDQHPADLRHPVAGLAPGRLPGGAPADRRAPRRRQTASSTCSARSVVCGDPRRTRRLAGDGGAPALSAGR
jgi:hypothetical protein